MIWACAAPLGIVEDRAVCRRERVGRGGLLSARVAGSLEAPAAQIRAVLGDQAAAIDHVGSASVPGLAAKDCIDVQARVPSIDEERLWAGKVAGHRDPDGRGRTLGG
jgi:hypothetical protein